MKPWNLNGRLASRGPQSATARRRPTFEALETRRLLAVDFDWAFTLGASSGDRVRDVTVDPAGNVGIIGTFVGTVDFDPGPGVHNLTTVPADGPNRFVAKYDAGGKLLSAQQFTGDAILAAYEYSIAFDASGNMLIAGAFTGNIQFASTTLTSQALEDAFVAKFDAIGNFVWARRFGGVEADSNGALAVDGAGNVLVGVNGSSDASIVKLDASGNELWTWRVGASTSAGRKNSVNSAAVSSITVDSAGNVFANGGLSGTVDFDPSAGVNTLSASSPSAFVVKLSSNGGLSWARCFEATKFGQVYSAGIGVGADGTVYSAGTYYDSGDFDPGTLKSQKFILTTGGNGAGYVSALDPSGNFLWAKSTRSVTNGAMIVYDFALDAANNVYVAGDFSGAIDFDPGAGTATLNTNNNSFLTFVWKLNANGGFEWAGQMGTQGDHYGYAIDVDASGNIYAAGRWSGSGDFDPGAGTYNLTSSAYDGYLVKLTQTSSLSLTNSSAIFTAENLLVASDNDTATRAKRDREGNRTHALSGIASSIDHALAEMEFSVWR
jgi:hypothetical protein